MLVGPHGRLNEYQKRALREASPRKQLTVVGLFAGIGGLEQGFQNAGHESVMLCESDPSAVRVLESKFPHATLTRDVRKLRSLPACDVVTAGFPCQDLSQVGRRQGISGPNSGLIEPVLTLMKKRRDRPAWLVLENVPFMLKLDGGRAIAAIVSALEKAGWGWAYRVVDTQAFGLPHRRRRVILLASWLHDPRPALLGQDSGKPEGSQRWDHACGFYWTEGNTGIGWAQNAIPPLKGGSGLHIPSPPAIWFPRRRSMAIPDIRDAERLQGFEADWTAGAIDTESGDRKRWRLIGNAVSVPVSEWIARRLSVGGLHDAGHDVPMRSGGAWPDAAWGFGGKRSKTNVSQRPVFNDVVSLASFLRFRPRSLTAKATAGFLSRLERSALNYSADFASDLRYHLKHAKKTADRARL